MRKLFVWCLLSVFVASVSLADEPRKTEKSEKTAKAEKPEKPGVKEMSGISILGNQDAPKSLVIVPWKSSEIGTGIGLSNSMTDRAAPVDKDVFARQLHYYELRSGGAGH
ncbi:MAG TPA: hypothetical protein VMU03_03645 [Gammaproteobacteria bacterium]|jgi:hypothetical protein|nr:hypothetical protein [Gammaproteobacteria bacterium]